VSLGAWRLAFERLYNLDAVAHLGETALSAPRRVHCAAAAGLRGRSCWCFVDAMRSCQATLLLRPFNSRRSATHVYQLPALEQFEARPRSAPSPSSPSAWYRCVLLHRRWREDELRGWR